MFCMKCGAKINDGVQFCTECGEPVLSQEPAAVLPPVQPTVQPPVQPTVQQQAYQQPVYQQPAYQQPVYQQTAYQQPVYQQPAYAQQPVAQPMPKKKRHVGLFVFLGILIVLAGVIIYMLGSLSLFKPKNLGIDYEISDYNSVVQKLGMHITADLGNGKTYDNASVLSGDLDTDVFGAISDENEGEKLSYKDYNWTFSNYQPKTMSLTPEEVTAFFNEIAPSFWWFDNTQVKVDADGKIITSSTADIQKIVSDLYPDIAGDIPIPLPGRVNLYTEGDFSVTNNQITMVPEVFKVGPISVPEEYLEGEGLVMLSDGLGRFITIIPGLQINSAGLDADGNFYFDGIVPTEVSITPKN